MGQNIQNICIHSRVRSCGLKAHTHLTVVSTVYSRAFYFLLHSSQSRSGAPKKGVPIVLVYVLDSIKSGWNMNFKMLDFSGLDFSIDHGKDTFSLSHADSYIK